MVSLQISHGADVCGLRPPSEDVPHPADLDADGEVTTEEFVQYAEANEAAKKQSMDANGDGQVTTEEFVKYAGDQAVGPIDFTAENFDEKTSGSIAAFVEFSAPWCGHCKTMQPAWNDLAVKVHSEYPGVRIGTVNCDEQREFCELFQIQGFPTLLLMKDPEAFEDATPVLYQKQRDFDSMFEFLKEEQVLATAA